MIRRPCFRALLRRREGDLHSDKGKQGACEDH